jgi:DNA-binding transcriptional regulator GbsR (MarR family)
MISKTERTEKQQGRIDAQSEVINALAEKKELNMWEIKEQKQLFYSTVHKAVKALQKEGLVEPVKSQKSQKGVKTTIFSLTFKGFIGYLASQTESWRPNVIAPIGDAEQPKRSQEKKNEELSKLLGITEAYGERLNYAIFEEIHWLTERYGPNLLHEVVDIARLVEASPGVVEYVERYRKELDLAKREKQRLLRNPDLQNKARSMVQNGKTVKKSSHDPVKEVNIRIRSAELCLERFLWVQNDWMKQSFAARLAQRILVFPAEGDMCNEALHMLFKQVADEFREAWVEPIEDMAHVFKSGDAKGVRRRILESINKRSTGGSVFSSA